ncbi:gpW family head-tail joining protein [Piscirickettsia litoralis]|uniref:Phage tail protein n=1 Tax=Piscirickettsia litoralis TaxID=1891921 RepID=A0ABX2ZYA0_9GAMM|nr:gpW family head-tail joining protein [Piscirickettsia litoralis]ODN41175.1 hypothetical protein BGC07_18040 [Piscirickettsia litoralis]
MYTQQNIDDVRQAIIDLATGKRTTSVSFNGTTVNYATADLPKLELLLSKMCQQVSKKSRISTIVGGKGL